MEGPNISKEYYNKIMERKNIEELEQLMPAYVMVALFMTVGFPGNIIVIIVYYRKMRRTASRYFIILLAVFDFINCVFTMPAEMALLSNFYTFDIPWFCKLSRFITYTTTYSSNLILLGIAVDRFRKICQATKRYCFMKHVKIFSICSIVFAILSSTPSIFLYGTNTVALPVVLTELNITLHGKTCLVQDKYWGSIFAAAFNTYLFCCMVIVFVVISIVYIIIGKEIVTRKDFQSFRKRTHYSKRSNIHNSNIHNSNIHNSDTSGYSVSFNSKATPVESSVLTCSSLHRQVLMQLETSTIASAKSEDNVMVSPMASSCSHLRPFRACSENESCSPLNAIDILPSSSESVICINSQSQSNVLGFLGKHDSTATIRKGLQQSECCKSKKTLSTRNDLKPTNGDHKTPKNEKSDVRISVRKTTFLLFLVTLFYIVSFLPVMVIVTIRNIYPDIYDRMSLVENSFYNLFLRTYFLNNVINPILYGFLNEQFRRRAVQVFREIFK